MEQTDSISPGASEQRFDFEPAQGLDRRMVRGVEDGIEALKPIRKAFQSVSRILYDLQRSNAG
jgi:hypothetical protein